MKIKKSLYTICLAVLLILSSLMLFACKKEETSKNVYASFNEFVTSVNDEDVVFKDCPTNADYHFYFKDFSSKSSAGYMVYEYEHYNHLVEGSLSFIVQHYKKLENLTLKTNYSSLKSRIKALKKNYSALKVEYTNMMEEAQDLSYNIYNGYFARYHAQAKSFINESYKCALSLGKFLTGKADLIKNYATENMTAEEVDLYVDYNILKIYEDYRKFFMDSCKGNDILNNYVYKNALNIISSFYNDGLYQEYKTITVEEAESLRSVLTKVDNERKINDKALSKFSVYKFTNPYNHSIEAYEKDSKFAGVYYNRISQYIASGKSESSRENTLCILMNYITENVII